MFLTASLAAAIGKIVGGFLGATRAASAIGWLLGILLAILFRLFSWASASYAFRVLYARAGGKFADRVKTAANWAIAYTGIELILIALHSAFCAIVALFT